MTDLADFLGDIRPLLPTATVMSVIRSARRATRDFCKKTKAYQLGFTQGGYTADGQDITLTLPVGAELQQLLVLKSDGIVVTPSSEKDAALNGQRVGYYIVPPDGFRLTAPAGALTGTAVLIPVYNAASIPDHIFSRYYEVLLNGVLADLYSTPTAAYFSPDMVAYYGAMYDAGVEDTTREVAGDDVFKPSVTAYSGI